MIGVVVVTHGQLATELVNGAEAIVGDLPRFAAVAIGWSAIRRFSEPHEIAAEATGIAVMATSMAVTLALVLWQTRVAARTGSRIVAADRLHYLSDLLPAAGAMIAIVASVRFGVHWLDPVIAIAACAALVYGARRIGLAAWDAILDSFTPLAKVESVED